MRQADLGELAGCSRDTISRLEGGRNRPQLETARRIAAALGGLPVEALFQLADLAHNDQERPPGALGGKVADDRGQPAEV